MDEWWRGAVIYQVYPRSFRDTDGDGIGDLAGIEERLDHIAALGVDALWISPFFKSPQKDYGYDVEDYRTVDPLFGTLADFDALLARAHDLGLKVMVDMVLSHTSSRHPWFLESRSSRENPKAGWYVWADARPDGTPPSNWLSIFGGVAWEWEPRRAQYYLHNFLREQPDLNVHHAAVVEALLGEAEFWLARGVDGFRLDAIDFAMHDPKLKDNPPRPAGEAVARGLRAATPYARQIHVHDKAHPDIPEKLLKPLRRLADRYGAALLGELSGDGQLARAAAYTRGSERLHFTYTFDLLSAPLSAAAIRAITGELEASLADGWPCWSFSNHDVVRAASRLGGKDAPEALARLLPVLLGALRGTICLYQGEELGLTEAELALEDLRDPVGIAFYPQSKGRDGARTPMPWRHDAPHGGFTTARPWLPVPKAHLALAVDLQEADPSSVLSHTRRFLRWRRTQPALVRGGMRYLDAPEPVLALVRGEGDGALLCGFNLGSEPVRYRLPAEVEPAGFELGARLQGLELALAAYGAYFGRLPSGGLIEEGHHG
ncbi:MAG: alpha-amylase family glycosyl hydrolase [Geminicoccaceae bacterium]